MTDQIPKLEEALEGFERFMDIVKEQEIHIEQVIFKENDNRFEFRVDLVKL